PQLRVVDQLLGRRAAHPDRGRRRPQRRGVGRRQRLRHPHLAAARHVGEAGARVQVQQPEVGKVNAVAGSLRKGSGRILHRDGEASGEPPPAGVTATPNPRPWTAWAILRASAAPAVAAPPDADKRRADALALAAKIDGHLDKAWADNKIVPAPKTDDAAFLRRVYLHLAGRIPSVAEVQKFLDDKSADKRVKVVEELLQGNRYPLHLANVWRAVLLPEAVAGSEARGFAGPLEAWLRSRLAADVGWDKIVRELLTAAPTNPGGGPDGSLLDIYGFDPGDGSTPLSLYQAKQFKPENLAEVTTRALLGVRLGCAQCHNHPTAQWKKEQFWEFAAFFAGVAPRQQQ